MSREERTGKRDLTFSSWHRRGKDDQTYIDVDQLGYCNKHKEALWLLEHSFENEEPKSVTMTRELARRANLPAFRLTYPSGWRGEDTVFKVKQVEPRISLEKAIPSEEFRQLEERWRSVLCGLCNGHGKLLNGGSNDENNT